MNDLSSKLSIDTPENILLDAEIAGFGTRCVAAIYDYTFILILLIIPAYLYGRIAGQSDGDDSNVYPAVLALIQFGVVMFYHLLFEILWNGQTPGKRMTGVRVVQTNGLPLTVGGAIIRNLVRLFDFLPIFYGIGMIVMFASKNTQRLGDLAARTVVIRERRQLTLNTLKENFKVHYFHITPIQPIPAYVTIEGLTADDRRAVIDYLGRRYDLRDRESIAGLVARRLAQKVGDAVLERDLAMNPRRAEVYLEWVARAFEVQESIASNE